MFQVSEEQQVGSTCSIRPLPCICSAGRETFTIFLPNNNICLPNYNNTSFLPNNNKTIFLPNNNNTSFFCQTITIPFFLTNNKNTIFFAKNDNNSLMPNTAVHQVCDFPKYLLPLEKVSLIFPECNQIISTRSVTADWKTVLVLLLKI